MRVLPTCYRTSEMDYRLDSKGISVSAQQGQKIFSSPQHPDLLCSPNSLIFIVYADYFLIDKAASITLTTLLSSAPRLRMWVVTHPTYHMPAQLGALLRTGRISVLSVNFRHYLCSRMCSTGATNWDVYLLILKNFVHKYFCQRPPFEFCVSKINAFNKWCRIQCV